MKSILRWCAAVAVVVAMSACGGGGGDAPTPTPTATVVALATVPAGLTLTLDGLDAPSTFSAQPGVSRTIGAANQTFNGRLYEFGSWSDGGAASHTIITPNDDTTYVATFIDRGPTNNNAPTVALLVAPTTGQVGVAMTLAGTAQDSDAGDSIAKVQYLDGGVLIGEATASPYAFSWTPTVAGAHSLRLRAVDTFGLTKDSAEVVVTIAP
jgi:Bacterial Ig domain